MMRKTATFLSYLLHPIVLPTLMTLLILSTPLGQSMMLFLSPKAYWYVLIVVFVSTFVLPVLILSGMKLTRALHSFQMETQLDRIVPLAITTLSFYFCYYMLKNISAFTFLSIYILGATLLNILALGITVFWKISLHGIGWGGATGALFLLSTILCQPYLWYFDLFILLSGVVGWARLKLDAHKPAEFYAGYGLGFAVMTLLFFFIFH